MLLWTFVYKILCRHVFISLEIVELLDHSSVQSLSHVRLCDPMDCRTPGFPAHYQFPEFTQKSCPLSWWCHPTISSSVVPFSSRLQSFPALGLFKWVSSSHQVAKILEYQFQHQSSNEHPGLISFRMDWLDLLAVQGTLKIFSNTTVQKHQFFGAQLSL